MSVVPLDLYILFERHVIVFDIGDHTNSGPWVCDGSTQMVRQMEQLCYGDGEMHCQTPLVPLILCLVTSSMGKVYFTIIIGPLVCDGSTQMLIAMKQCHYVVCRKALLFPSGGLKLVAYFSDNQLQTYPGSGNLR